MADVEFKKEPFYKVIKLSRDERKIISDHLVSHAQGLLDSSYDDNIKKANRIITEADRFKNCGHQYLKYTCERDHLSFKIKYTCKSRICPECGAAFYGRIYAPLFESVKECLAHRRRGWMVSLLTLTVDKKRFNSQMPTRSDIERLYKESSKFFRLFFGKYKGVWTKNSEVREDRRHYRGAGSVSVIEVGADNNNLHVHAIIYHPFIPFTELKNAWLKITGDSYIVDIRSTEKRNTRQVVNYVLKYITKPPQTDSYYGLANYLLMIKGSRRLRCSGIFYNTIKLPRAERLKKCCPHCGGELKFAGVCDFHVTDPEEYKVKELSALLRTVAETGRFVKYPPWSEIWSQDSYAQAAQRFA